MDALVRERPDLAEKVKTGEMKGTEAMRIMKKDSVAKKIAELPKGKYRVIYADPPWSYNDSREGLGAGEGQTTDRASSAAKNHYPTMPLTDIKALDVKTLAAKDCVLFLWGTFPLLPAALDVIEAWGFKYKTAFVWDKKRGAFGHYHKAEAELLFIATHGSCTPDSDKREAQIQCWPRGKHSQKPKETIDMIEELYCKGGPRIELFCRGNPKEGWTAWGAESET